MMRTTCLLTGLLAAAWAPLLAQTPDTLKVDAALEAVREGRNGDQVVAILTQRDGPRRSQELDAVAESLVVIATAVDESAPLEALLAARRASRSARSALARAAGAERGGTPYARALDALVRIIEVAEQPWLRASTVQRISTLPGDANRTRAIQFLIDVATSEEQEELVRYRAIEALANDTGDEGRAAARRLYETGAIPPEGSMEGWAPGDYLQHLAKVFGWEKG